MHIMAVAFPFPSPQLCGILDSRFIATAKQRAYSVNTDTNRLVFTCVRSLSEQLKNHIPMKISRQAEMTAEKSKKKSQL